MLLCSCGEAVKLDIASLINIPAVVTVTKNGLKFSPAPLKFKKETEFLFSCPSCKKTLNISEVQERCSNCGETNNLSTLVKGDAAGLYCKNCVTKVFGPNSTGLISAVELVKVVSL